MRAVYVWLCVCVCVCVRACVRACVCVFCLFCLFCCCFLVVVVFVLFLEVGGTTVLKFNEMERGELTHISVSRREQTFHWCAGGRDGGVQICSLCSHAMFVTSGKL